MYLVGAKGQQRQDNLYDASGTIAAGNTAQLLLPVAVSRGYLQIQNISDTVMFIKFGAARLTATMSGGAIASVTVVDGGFGFTNTILPLISVEGGGQSVATGFTFVGVGQPGYTPPTVGSNNVATAHPARLKPVMAAGAIASVTVEDGGSGYKTAPYLHVMNNQNDPIGCATASATSGFLLAANGGSLTFGGTMCPTDAISIFCASSSKAFTCMWGP